MTSSLRPFFTPSGVAVIGASSNPHKLSFGILRNLKEGAYSGGIYPVNPGASSILDLPCYPDISAVPDPVELAVVVVPVQLTPQTVEACGRRGIKAAIIITGGFKEVGSDGAAMEQKVLETAKQYGMRLIGPNCVGLMNLHAGLNTTFINGTPDVGGIGFLSQSGAICGGVVEFVRGKKVGFSHFISMGNEADVTETDIMEYLADDPQTRVICAYVEQIRDGARFLQVAREVSRRKPIVLLKAGRSDAGARAVSSHTGSLAGSYAAYQAAFRQAGVIEATSFAELFDLATAFDFQPLAQGNRAVIITNAGGPAALASDSLSFHGITLKDPTEESKAVLRAHLNPSAQVGNPIDMLGAAEPADYELAVKTMLADPNIDAVIPLLVPQALVSPAGVAQAVVDAAQGAQKPVLACIMGDEGVRDARLILQGSRIPMYTYPETMGTVLQAMLDYRKWLQEYTPLAAPEGEKVKQAAEKLMMANPAAVWGEAETRPLLEAYGIPLAAGKTAHDAAEAGRAAAEVGFPVVMKIISPQLLHKSDAGGIKLNLRSVEEVEQAYTAMMQSIHAARPDADLQGVLIEKMLPKGQEVIVGMRRDPGFGPLMMFGLGGIYVELFKDVAFRVAPLREQDAREMIAETRAYKLLTGFRGQPRADVDAVVQTLMRLSQAAVDFPEIDEMEINPLLVLEEGKGAVALDCRMIRKG